MKRHTTHILCSLVLLAIAILLYTIFFNNPDDKLFETLKKKDYSNAIEWLHKGASATAQDKKGRTPLHYADDMKVARLLIDKGADVNAMGEGKKLQFILLGEKNLSSSKTTHHYIYFNLKMLSNCY